MQRGDALRDGDARPLPPPPPDPAGSRNRRPRPTRIAPGTAAPAFSTSICSTSHAQRATVLSRAHSAPRCPPVAQQHRHDVAVADTGQRRPPESSHSHSSSMPRRLRGPAVALAPARRQPRHPVRSRPSTRSRRATRPASAFDQDDPMRARPRPSGVRAALSSSLRARLTTSPLRAPHRERRAQLVRRIGGEAPLPREQAVDAREQAVHLRHQRRLPRARARRAPARGRCRRAFRSLVRAWMGDSARRTAQPMAKSSTGSTTSHGTIWLPTRASTSSSRS